MGSFEVGEVGAKHLLIDLCICVLGCLANALPLHGEDVEEVLAVEEAAWLDEVAF